MTSTFSNKRSSSSSAASSSKLHPPSSSKSDPSSTFHSHRRHHSAFTTLNSSTDNLCTGVRRGFCFTAGSGPSASVKAVMKNPMPLMDQHEFDTLPPAIRRKYFSSLERLRYATQQQQQQPSITIKSPPSHLRSFSTVTKIRGTSRDNGSFRCNSPLRQRQLKLRKQNKGDTYVLTQTDAQWFLDLPETIKRKHFSPEERQSIARKCESIIVDAADEKLYMMNFRSRNDSTDSTATELSQVAPLHRKSVDSDIVQATNEVRNSFRWMENDGELDLRLLQFRDPFRQQPTRTPSKRHTLSLASRTVRVADTTPPPTGTRNRSTMLARRASTIQRSSPKVSHVAKASIDGEALYYQDPQARLQLRVYLASPQKFDEAVEFGFPSQTEPHKFYKQRPLEPTIRKVSVESIDFDEKPNLEASLGCTFAELEKQDVDVSARMARGAKAVLDRYPHASTGNREMTLRMTLTRKDLREDDLTPPNTTESVLSQAELPPEKTGLPVDWDAIDREAESGIRRLWRRVKGH
ncbi:hypothetical protein EX30DRAFT_307033 [Ascodesmis nigricans]|uniref:Uncharacterized protein n=1 Tax=Ascodesmis nigricans TaxID=341454 RepID=A0A4S2MWE1_9PEZI|nr:hypothetical protein EX30DRAFT_307033 [Ascodesmis nigricans]